MTRAGRVAAKIMIVQSTKRQLTAVAMTILDPSTEATVAASSRVMVKYGNM